jgi:RHS repeat-associated protein
VAPFDRKGWHGPSEIASSSVNNSYNEHLTYDLNGNILSLERNGEKETEQFVIMIDDLDYDYDGNRLINVKDATGHSDGFNDGNDPQHTQLNDFEYDDYGNMVEDRNKKITNITYNHLNLPKKITFENNQSIEYIYGADGSKLRKKVTDGTTNTNVDYLSTSTPLSTGGFQYTDEILEFFPHTSTPLSAGAEGYVTVNTNQLNDHYNYVFNYTDHTSTSLSTGLGNIRLKYTAHPQTGEPQPLEETKERGLRTPLKNNQKREQNHYYPFACPERRRRGLTHDGYQPHHDIIGLEGANVTIIPTSPNVGDPYKYKYNGKESKEELGLDWYDYGARNFDASLGRWFGVDGLAEKYLSNSPYHYANNNPVLNYDVDGNYFVNFQSLFAASTFQRNSRQQIEKNNKSIEQLNDLIQSGDFSENAVANLNSLISNLEGVNTELQTSIDEVSTLMGSNQGYNIENAGAFSLEGHTTYDFSTGIVNIRAPLGNGFGLLGHELHPAFQFDQGITSLASTSGVRIRPGIDLIGVDLADEWNAYKRQEAIEPGSSPYKTYNALNNDSKSFYTNHSRTPQSVSQHAQIQKILKSNGTKADKARWLNNLSKRFQQAFRINRRTYDGKN